MVHIDDDIDDRLRVYINQKWLKPHGKITQVIEKALD